MLFLSQVDVPFAFDDEERRDAALLAAAATLPCRLQLLGGRPDGLDYARTPPRTLVAFLRDPVARAAAEYESCCVRRAAAAWCARSACVAGEPFGAFAERRGDAQLRALAPGEACGAAARPPPNGADLRVVEALVPAFEALHVYDPNPVRGAYSHRDLDRAEAATALDARLLRAAAADETRLIRRRPPPGGG